MNTKRLLPALIAALGFGAAQAQISVFYGLNDNNNVDISGSAGTVVAADISATAFVRSETSQLGTFQFRDETGALAPVEGSHNRRAGSGNSTANPAGAAGPEGKNTFLSFTITNNHATDAVLITGFNRWVGGNNSAGQTVSILTDIVVGSNTTSLGLWTSATTVSASARLDQTSLGATPDFTTVTLGAGETATVRQWVGSTQAGRFWYFDDMTVTITAIPEPGTLALVGIALGSLLLFRRRR